MSACCSAPSSKRVWPFGDDRRVGAWEMQARIQARSSLRSNGLGKWASGSSIPVPRGHVIAPRRATDTPGRRRRRRRSRSSTDTSGRSSSVITTSTSRSAAIMSPAMPLLTHSTLASRRSARTRPSPTPGSGSSTRMIGRGSFFRSASEDPARTFRLPYSRQPLSEKNRLQDPPRKPFHPADPVYGQPMPMSRGQGAPHRLRHWL